jgi:hypothetical protein
VEKCWDIRQQETKEAKSKPAIKTLTVSFTD